MNKNLSISFFKLNERELNDAVYKSTKLITSLKFSIQSLIGGAETKDS